jgi:putative polyhydroxyalkanoate system protein
MPNERWWIVEGGERSKCRRECGSTLETTRKDITIMADITRTKNYDFDSTEMRARLEKLADEMHAKLGIKCRWDGDTCQLSGSGIKSGAVRMTSDTVSIEISLGMMAKMLKGQIEAELDKRIERLTIP